MYCENDTLPLVNSIVGESYAAGLRKDTEISGVVGDIASRGRETSESFEAGNIAPRKEGEAPHSKDRWTCFRAPQRS